CSPACRFPANTPAAGQPIMATCPACAWRDCVEQTPGPGRGRVRQRHDKGVVAERLSHYYQIPLEQIATLGDGANDVLMFRRSGLSIAMGNASEEVRRQATCVTASNDDEGFAKAVEEFILPRAVAAPVVSRPGRQ